MRLETSELYLNASATDQKALRESTLTAIRIKDTAAAKDSIEITRMEAEGQLKVADAYAVSTAAGLKAEAQAKAQADHFRNSQVDVNKQADAYLRLGAAQAAVSSSQAVAVVTEDHQIGRAHV